MSTAMNVVTDVIMTAQCAVAWKDLRARGPEARPWAAFFGLMAWAATAGAVRHGVEDGTPVMYLALLGIDIALGAAVFAAERGTLAWQAPDARRPLARLFLIQLAVFGVAALGRLDFMPAFWDSAMGFGWVLAAAVVAGRLGREGAADIARGLGLGVGAGVAYLIGRGPAAWFNHVDVAHTLSIGALLLLHRGARREAVGTREVESPDLGSPEPSR